VIAFTQLCRIAPLDTQTALAAADICGQHKLATADAIIYATALNHGADLVTCDAHFDGLRGVTLIPKIGG
jgi:predicted nucleic acid-binding protein